MLKNHTNIKQAFSFFITLFFFATAAFSQNTIYVDNNVGSITTHKTLQAAIDAASNNDIIILQGSGTTYGAGIMNKPLTILGPGYLLGQNPTPNTQANIASATVTSLEIKDGANNSFISGLYFDTNKDGNSLIINGVSNVFIQRNRFYNLSSNWYSLYMDNINNINILNNYFDGEYTGFIGTGLTSNSIKVKKNIFNGNGTFYRSVFRNATFENNNCRNGAMQFHKSTVNNNLINSGGNISNESSNSENSFNNNFLSGTNNLGNNSNKISTNFTAIYVTGNNSPDGQFQLSSTSSAKGAGVNGEDCGAFGGNTPYVLSGIPAVPHIYQLNVANSGTTSGGLKVSLKVRANN